MGKIMDAFVIPGFIPGTHGAAGVMGCGLGKTGQLAARSSNIMSVDIR